MGNFADFKEYGARAPGANEIANCPTHVHDPSRSLLNLRDDRHYPPHRRDDHLHQKTSPPFISEDRCRLSHPGNHGTLDRVSSGSCSLTRKQNCHPELPLPLLPQKHPLPALSLISAMSGIVLLVIGIISLFQKPSRPALQMIGALLLTLGITGLWICAKTSAAV